MSQERSEAYKALLRPKRMLLVEDNQLDAELTKKTLDKCGVETSVVSSAEQALGSVKAHDDFDVVLVDLSLVGMSGREFIKTLQNMHYKATCVILSGREKNNITSIAKELGVLITITKPLTETHVKELLMKL